MKLIIENFQSIEHCEIEIPEKSFTCIVGPSNIGKSAIRRAVECLLYNKSEVSFIRNGASSCKVTGVFDDGMEIEWSRTKKSSAYKINGEPYTKLNKSVPEPLLDKGFSELVVNKDKYSVQVASQFNNIFLLNQTGGKVTDVLSNLGNLNRLITSNKLCLTDLKGHKSKLSVRRDDIKFAKAKVSSYSGLDTQIDILSSVKESFKELKGMKDKHSKLSGLSSRLGEAVKTVKILLPAKDVEVSNLDIDVTLLASLGRMHGKYTTSSKLRAEYRKVEAISDFSLELDISQIASLRGYLDKLNNIEMTHSLYQTLSSIKSDDLGIDLNLDSFKNLSRLERDLSKATRAVGGYTELRGVTPVEGIDLESFKTILGLSNRLGDSKLQLTAARTKLKEASDKMEALGEEEELLRKELKVCPLCDKDL